MEYSNRHLFLVKVNKGLLTKYIKVIKKIVSISLMVIGSCLFGLLLSQFLNIIY